VIGLYLFLRVAMARAGLKSSKPKGTLPPPEEG
jgi:hypothetical protein